MSGRRRDLLLKIYNRLLDFWGPQYWWPAETPFEVIIGAILTQNTSWTNVEKSILNLRERGLLSFDALSRLNSAELAPLVRSSGYFNQKAKKIEGFLKHVQENWHGDLDRFLFQDMDNLRSELLTLRGIGPETADSIVLYAAFQPTFVVDAYTYRVFQRHGWIEENIGYEDLRSFFMDSLEPDVKLFQEYHALLVMTGKLHCRKQPQCGSCPLQGLGVEGSVVS